MIKSFLKHHLTRMREEGSGITGLRNCHARGLDSIMLGTEVGNRIRMFVAHPNHELWQAGSIAYHPHHCDVTLARIYGTVVNVLPDLQQDNDGNWSEYLFDSVICGGKGSFTPTGQHYNIARLRKIPVTSEGMHMHASTIHTIQLYKGLAAAWFVMEGREWAGYRPYAYTSNPEFDTEGMYQPMTEFEVRTLINDVFHNIGGEW